MGVGGGEGVRRPFLRLGRGRDVPEQWLARQGGVGAKPQPPVMSRDVSGLGVLPCSLSSQGSKGLAQESWVVLAEVPTVRPQHPCEPGDTAEEGVKSGLWGGQTLGKVGPPRRS